MLGKMILPGIFLLLGYGFWASPEFKTVTAGVAIFLFGMLSLEEGFRTFTGGTLEKILRVSTNRIWKSLSFGVITTSIMQSSSLVSVITISFVSAGLLELAPAIGIVFGANLGTTTGAWLVAGYGLRVNLAAYAMPLLVFGIILVLQKAKRLKGAGYVLGGIGFLFLGVHFMKEGFDSVSQTFNLAEHGMTGYAGVLAFTGLGIVATVVMQSSHATLVLILAALAAQQVSYENALALAIGSNIGTTITAILGSLGSGANGKRLAWAHVIFNLTTGLIAIAGIYQLMTAVAWISAGLGIAADDYTLQLAVFHTLFNLIGILVMLPLLRPLVVFLQRAIPDPVVEVEHPVYLNEATRETPDAAVEAVRKETVRLYDLAVEVMTAGLSIRRELLETREKPKRIVRQSSEVIEEDINDLYERKLKALYGAIVEFVIRIRGGYSQGRLRENLNHTRQAGQHVIEAVKGVKHLRKNLVRFMRSDNVHIRKEYDKLRRLIVKVLERIDLVRTCGDPAAAFGSLESLEHEIDAKTSEIVNGLDELIREDAINVTMATSLMNDISYCREICTDLIAAGKSLFQARETEPAAGI